MMDFVSILDQLARTRSEHLALKATGREWSYAELADASRRAAADRLLSSRNQKLKAAVTRTHDPC